MGAMRDYWSPYVAGVAPGAVGRQAMVKNIGGIEKPFRIVLGLIVLALVVVGPQTWWGLIGIIPLATGLWGF